MGEAGGARSEDGSGRDCAARLRVLGDGTRLAVLRRLLGGPRTVGELAAEGDVEQSLLSHHLRTLREAGLVRTERSGRRVAYRLAPGVRVADEGLDLGCCRLTFERGEA